MNTSYREEMKSMTLEEARSQILKENTDLSDENRMFISTVYELQKDITHPTLAYLACDTSEGILTFGYNEVEQLFTIIASTMFGNDIQVLKYYEDPTKSIARVVKYQ